MAKSLLRNLLHIGLFLNTIKVLKALQPTPVTVGQPDLRANPEPTPRAVLEEGSNLLGRSYYNTLCGYVNGDLNYAISCLSGNLCATAGNINIAGCCNPNELSYCSAYLGCIPYGGICDEACQENNSLYRPCGSLAPYCLTVVFEYSALYYLYDCQTFGGVVTVQNVATSPVAFTIATMATSPAAFTIATTATVTNPGNSGISITCGNDSNCGNGDGNNGNGNGVGNESVGSIRTAPSSVRLLSLVCIVVFVWL